MNRTWYCIIIFMVQACAGVQQTRGHISSDHGARFIGDGGEIVLRLGQGVSTLPTGAVTVSDCSNARFFCFISNEFSIVVPRLCSEFSQWSWQVGRYESHMISQMPHTDRLLVASYSSPNIAFIVSPSAGLTQIYFDSQRRELFGPNGGWATLSSNGLPNLIYRKHSGDPILKCTDAR
jgi:hypothetical protein